MKTTRQPTIDENIILNKILDTDARKLIRQRAKIVLLSLKSYSCRKVAELVNCDKDTVSIVVRIWNARGIGGILTYRYTDRWKQQVKRRKALEKLVETSPKSLNLKFTTWSLKKLNEFFKDFLDYPISPTTVWRDVRILGLKYYSTKDTFIWKSPDYDIKRAWLKYLKRYLPPNFQLLHLDEKGPVHALRYSGHSWSFLQPQRDIRQKSNGKITFLGAYNKKDKKLVMEPMESHDSYGFCQAMDWITLEFLKPPFNHLIVVLDNAPIHHSEYTKRYFDDQSNIDVFFLPTYSPELNPIEICFKHYKHELLENNSFSNKEELIHSTYEYCEYYGDLRTKIYA